MHLKISSGKWRPFCLGLNVLNQPFVIKMEINSWIPGYRLTHCFLIRVESPLNTWCNNNVVITSKRRHFDVISSKWRRFDVITTLLFRNVSAGMCWLTRCSFDLHCLIIFVNLVHHWIFPRWYILYPSFNAWVDKCYFKHPMYMCIYINTKS